MAWNATASNCNQCHYRLRRRGWRTTGAGNDKASSKVVQGEFTGYGHGKSGAAPLPLACTACHNMGVAHDFSAALNGAGNNPYRLTAGFTCSNTTASCHQAGKSGPVSGVDISTVANHDKALMGADGKRTWPWTPQCANCHDPHGDAANMAMIGNEIYDNNLPLNLLAPPGGIAAQNTGMVFTNAALGQGNGSYAWNTTMTPNFSGVCQECHVAAGTGMLSYLDDTNTSASAHPGATGGTPETAGCATSTRRRSSRRGARGATGTGARCTGRTTRGATGRCTRTGWGGTCRT